MSITAIWGQEPQFDKAAEILNTLAINLEQDLWDKPQTALTAYGSYAQQIRDHVMPLVTNNAIAAQLDSACSLLIEHHSSDKLPLEEMVGHVKTVMSAIDAVRGNIPALADRSMGYQEMSEVRHKNFMASRETGQPTQPVLGYAG